MSAVRKRLLTAAGLWVLQFLAAPVFAQGTAFSYQGRLNANGVPANGSYDVAFTLFATNVTGTAIAGPVTNAGVVVSNGLFTTTVDFGAEFSGQSNWLEIAVGTNGATAFSTLLPRQQLTPVPYALMAANVSGPVSLSQLPPNVVTNGASSPGQFVLTAPGGIFLNGPTTISNNPTFTSTNVKMGIHVTNDANGNTILDFYGMSNSVGQFDAIMFSQVPGDGTYGFLAMNANHAGGVHNSPANTEFGLDGSGAIAFIPGLYSAESHIQLGGSGVARVSVFSQYDQTGSGPVSAIYPSGLFTAHTGWQSPVGLDVLDPGWHGRIVSTNGELKWETAFFGTAGYWGANGDGWTDATITNLDHLYWGTNALGNLFWNAVFTGGVLGSTSNSISIDTNRITLRGPTSIATNVAPFTVVSNFAPSLSTVYTNLSGTRVMLVGNVTLSASSGTCTFYLNYTNGASGFQSVYSATAGSGETVGSQQQFMIPLSPGGTFMGVNATGGANFSGNCIMWGM